MCLLTNNLYMTLQKRWQSFSLYRMMRCRKLGDNKLIDNYEGKTVLDVLSYDLRHIDAVCFGEVRRGDFGMESKLCCCEVS